MKKNDLTGQKFGKLTVLGDDGTRSHDGGIKWHCSCDCGGETHVVGHKLKTGHTKTCGCGARVFFKPKSTTTHELRNIAISRIIGRYKSKAKDRNLHWGISRELFIKTIEKPCYYCGTFGSLSLVIDDFEYLHNGVDRIDSDKGYEQSNIVPCCKNCNMAKSNMTQLDFYNWIINAADFIKTNRLNEI